MNPNAQPPPTQISASQPVSIQTDSRNLLIIFLGSFTFLLLVTIVFIIVFFELYMINPFSTESVSHTKNYTQLPLALDNKDILRSYIVYELRGEIEKIKDTQDGTEITSNIVNKGTNLVFTANDKTIVNIYTNSNPRLGSLNDLRIGQSVDIVGQYQIKEGSWIAKAVLINDFATASAEIEN